MGEFPIENHHCSCGDLQRYEVYCRIWKRCLIEIFKHGAFIVRSHAAEDFPQRRLVAAGGGPEATVVNGGIFDREPESGYRQRVGV